MPRAARATSLAQQLLQAHVRYQVDQLTGERGHATVSALVEDVLHALGEHELEEVLDRTTAADIVISWLAAVPGSAAAAGVRDLVTDVLRAGPAEPVTPADIVDDAHVAALTDALISLHPRLEQVLDRLTDSPLVGTVAARFMGRIVGEAVAANQEFADRVPGLGSLISFGTSATSKMMGAADRQLSGRLGDSMGRGGAYAVRKLNRVVADTVGDPITREAVLQVWELVSREPIGGLPVDAAGRAAVDQVADALHDLVVVTAANRHVADLVTSLVNGFFDRFGGYTPTELLAEFDIDRTGLVADVAAIGARGLDVLGESGALDELVRAQLAPFYESSQVAALLS
ncbi:MAG TPA: hypothetical protein PLX71_05055 [Phycicoccus sp.]|nr:hypothetical protein [Phycicoccus sp.]